MALYTSAEVRPPRGSEVEAYPCRSLVYVFAHRGAFEETDEVVPRATLIATAAAAMLLLRDGGSNYDEEAGDLKIITGDDLSPKGTEVLVLADLAGASVSQEGSDLLFRAELAEDSPDTLEGSGLELRWGRVRRWVSDVDRVRNTQCRSERVCLGAGARPGLHDDRWIASRLSHGIRPHRYRALRYGSHRRVPRRLRMAGVLGRERRPRRHGLVA